MDGLKRRLNESVQLKLSFTLSLAILVVAIVAGVFSFLSAFDEAHELQDDVLRQVAQLMDRQLLSPTVPPTDTRLKDADEEARVIVQRLGEVSPSTVGVDAGGVLPLPATLADGLHTLEVGGETFRVLVKTTASGERIAVAQESGFRNEIARDGALRTVMPFLILVPVLLLIVADLVRKMFRPIAALSREIDQRAEQELHPVDDRHLPAEVRPFAVAINRLLTRVGQSMDAQRRFVADAAHELRSPLTRIRMGLELMGGQQPSPAFREEILRNIAELDQLVDEILLSSRLDAREADVGTVEEVDLIGLAAEECARVDADLDVSAVPEGLEAHGISKLLRRAIRNLLENARRYSTGEITVVVQRAGGMAEVRVCDRGPGVPPAQRERIFEAFYRLPGHAEMSGGVGLGLNLVKQIALAHQGSVRCEAREGGGSRFVLSLPLAQG